MSTTSDRACLVCGDRTVSGTHFGAITCESCKAFFRRNALNNQNKYVCISAGNCKIDVETRIYCKKCRLDKCFAIGMKSSLIIVKQKRGVNPDINGNYENTQQLNNKLQVNGNMFDNNKCKTINEQNNKLSNNLNVNQLTANKLNSNNTIKPLVMPIIRPISDYSNTFNELESNRLCELLDALKLMVYPVVNTGDQLILQNFMEAHDVVLDRQEHEIQNIIKMSKSLHTFNSLTEHDKLVLIKYSAIPINNLRLLMKFDYDDMAWTVCTKNGLFNVRLDLFKMSSNMDPYNIHHNFLTSMGLEWDSEVLAIHLLTAILLFNPNCPKLINRTMVRLQQNIYIYLLQRFLQMKYRSDLLAKTKLSRLVKNLEHLNILDEQITIIVSQLDLKSLPLFKEICDRN